MVASSVDRTPDLSISPTKVLGMSPTVRGNGIFFDSQKILYVCEKSLVKYDLKDKIGHVVINTLLKERRIDSFTINPIRSLICLGLSGRDSLISLYERNRNGYEKNTKLYLTNGGPNSGSVVHVDFSAKSNFLGLVVARPHRLCVFSLQRNIIMLNLRFTHFHGRITRKLHQVIFNPVNDKVFLLIGDGVFRIIRLKIVTKSGDWEMRFKSMGFYQAKYLPLTTACWYDENRVLAGTKDGRLLVVENCLIKGIYFLNSLPMFFIPMRPPNIKVRECVNWTKVAQRQLEEFEEFQLRQIAAFDRGFVVANKRLLIFEEPHDRTRWFIRVKVFELESLASPAIFLNMHSNKANRLVTCCTQRKNIYQLDINKLKDSIGPEQLENISDEVEKIKSLSTCLWKPVCLSLCGRTVCLFDYNSAEIINKWTFRVKGKNVSLDPSGTRFCLTLESSLCIFLINHNHDFSHRFRNCELNLQVVYQESFSHCVFSNGGARFGGSTRSKIYIFSSTTYQILNVFETEVLLIRSFIDDNYNTITSISSGGLTLRHDLQTGRVVWKYQSSCQEACTEFVDCKVQKIIYISHSNGSVTKIDYSGKNKVQSNFSLALGGLRGVAISPSSGEIFFGSQGGSILQVKLSDLGRANPDNMDAMCYKVYPVQSHGISQMVVTPTNKLITGNEDGCLCVYDLEGGPTLIDYECPHKSTDFILGSLSLLKFITSVRKMNEKILKDWYVIKEFMVNEKFVNWAEENSSKVIEEMKAVEKKLEDIEVFRNYYDSIWSEMDSFWEPQESKHVDICNNYLYYNIQFRSKDNIRHDGWTRGLWHINHIDTASKALCSVLDETLLDVFDKKTVQDRYIREYNAILDSQMQQIDEARAKVDKACHVYRKLYTIARNTWNGLQHFILQEGNVDPPKEFNKELNKKHLYPYIAPFKEDFKILHKVYKSFLHEAYVRSKEIVELSYFENGPTGITMKLLPNLMTSEFEITKKNETKDDDLMKYLNSLPIQWIELRRWDWLIQEAKALYHNWYLLGQGNFGNAFYNSHAYHELRDEEMLKHLHKKQLSLLHNFSSKYASISRSLKFVNQLYSECVKVQNNVEMKFYEIKENIDNFSKEELFNNLMDVFNTVNKPNKIREGEFYLKKLKKTKLKKRESKVFMHTFCPIAPFLIKCPKSGKSSKTQRVLFNKKCYC